MSNVTQLPMQRPRIFVCNCGCSTFNLREDGHAECAFCETIADASNGGWFDATRDAKDTEVEQPISDIQGNGSADFAMARVRQIASQPDIKVIAVASESGSVHVWSAAESQDQTEWALEKLAKAASLIERNAPK